jgi:hypothetical protein
MPVKFFGKQKRHTTYGIFVNASLEIIFTREIPACFTVFTTFDTATQEIFWEKQMREGRGVWA